MNERALPPPSREACPGDRIPQRRRLGRLARRMVIRVLLTIGFLLLVNVVIFLSLIARLPWEAHALFDPAAPAADLPLEVRIALDGFAATFHKGTPGYARFVGFLRTSRSPELSEAAYAAAPVTGLRNLHPCGEITIPHYGWPFRYHMARSKDNRYCLWICLPHMHRNGSEIRLFFDDGRLMRLVEASGGGSE